MKRIYITLCSILLTFSLSACSVGQAQLPNSTPPAISPPSSAPESELPTVEETSELQLELTTAQGETILFALNDSNAAKSLFEQMPLSLDIEDYSDNEKIFYPPEKLDTSDTPLAKGPAGTLAYYAPWGDVAIYYGDCGGASGLYQLGQVVSGAEYISQLSGVVQLEAISDSVSWSVSTPPENTDIPKAPPSTNVQKPSQNATDTSVTPPVQEEAPSSPTSPPSTPRPTSPPSTPSPTPPPSTPRPTPPPSTPRPTPPPSTPSPTPPEENIMNSIQITIGSKVFSATLETNDSVNAFVQLLQSAPVVIQMSDYSGFEKVGALGTSLPENNRQITAQSGDIVLYNGNQVCVFYGSNSWSYTKLGKIDNLSGWAEALGSGDATLTFSLS